MVDIRILIGPNRLPINIRLITHEPISKISIKQILQESLRPVMEDPGYTKGDILAKLTETCKTNNWTWTSFEPNITINLCHTS